MGNGTTKERTGERRTGGAGAAPVVMDVMTDAEVAAYFRISTYTLQKRMREGFRQGETDLNAAEPERLGGRRWWYRPKVEALAQGRAYKA